MFGLSDSLDYFAVFVSAIMFDLPALMVSIVVHFVSFRYLFTHPADTMLSVCNECRNIC